ncbi:MAG: GNAT family N-acetyltransferase, partial [Gammaproteobacteria bacterium]|nr:GNAT family N-acetyltransferase [Gammaproteobacteria bacterium]
AYQGRGIGRLLLNHMLTRSRTLPVERVCLEVRVSNERAIKLYQSVGFKQVGVRKDYYQHEEWGREDAFVLALSQYGEPNEPKIAFR